MREDACAGDGNDTDAYTNADTYNGRACGMD